jgi:hypothetical protein
MGGQKLSGAEFKIYTDKTMKTEAQNLVPVPGGGTEIRYGADGGRTYVSKDSEFRLDGFVADCNYYIQEVKAPAGYQKLQAPAKLKIFYQEGGDFEGFRARIYFNKYENGVLKSYTNNTFNISSEINGYGGCGGYHIYIPNTISGQRLPDTGFTDCFRKYHLLAALGAAVLVAALAYLAGRCRVQNH